jgi:hypothetical protein
MKAPEHTFKYLMKKMLNMENLLKPISIKFLISGIYNYLS